MNNHTEELQKILTDTCVFLKDITDVETEKLEAALKNNVLLLEDCIKKEQALVLRSRGLDQKRQKLQKSMGAESLTLKQIVEAASAEDRAALDPLYQKLTAGLKEYREVYESAKTAIEINLHRINTGLEQMTGKQAEGGVAYSDHGEKLEKPHTFTSRRA